MTAKKCKMIASNADLWNHYDPCLRVVQIFRLVLSLLSLPWLQWLQDLLKNQGDLLVQEVQQLQEIQATLQTTH